MISILIISHNQDSYLIRMINALNEQLPNLNRLFVLDRCIDNSVEILTQYKESFVIKSTGIGFEAGATRDYGLGFLPEDDILFLDGDRIPHNLTEDLLIQASGKVSICLIKAEYDYRTCFCDVLKEIFSINNVVSCGMLINRSAINEIKIHNSGRVFHEAFDGNWGCEDGYLGELSNHLNISCGAFSQQVFVEGAIDKKFLDWEPYKKTGFRINKTKLIELNRLLFLCACRRGYN